MQGFFDDRGEPANTVSYETLKALSPLTTDPAATLEKLGIDDPKVKAALTRIAELAKQG